MHLGIIGAVIGGICGFLGGIIGTYFSIKNTDSHRERTFVIKAVVVCWLVIILFLTLLLTIPQPYNWLVWIPYGILLPFGIRFWNSKQTEIRRQETEKEDWSK